MDIYELNLKKLKEIYNNSSLSRELDKCIMAIAIEDDVELSAGLFSIYVKYNNDTQFYCFAETDLDKEQVEMLK